jgi:hypothetical protein
MILGAEVANSGNISTGQPVNVRFYNGDPGQDGTLIGETQIGAPLAGCGAMMTVQILWPSLEPGTARVWVEVDPGNLISEADEQDNLTSATIVIPRALLYLPAITHGMH